MNACEKLLAKARSSRGNFSFTDLTKLARCYEYEFRLVKGGHHMYERREPHDFRNFQPGRGSRAKPEQVRDLVRAIDAAASGER